MIEPEEVTNQRQWRWKVVEPGGNTLLRLGTGGYEIQRVGLRCVRMWHKHKDTLESIWLSRWCRQIVCLFNYLLWFGCVSLSV